MANASTLLARWARDQSHMTADYYLRGLLARERAAVAALPLASIVAALAPTLLRWGNGQIDDARWSGSLAKGTATNHGSDADLFLSLRPDTKEPLGEIYRTLFNALAGGHFLPQQQNVSIGVTVFPLTGGAFKVDVVPGKRWDHVGADHSLFRSRASTWTKTNIQKHISFVQRSARVDEITVVKLWAKQVGLAVPSFPLELAVIEGCRGRRVGDLAGNVWAALGYLRDEFEEAILLDPGNASNRVSDDLTVAEKKAVARAAGVAFSARTWGEIVT